MSNGSFGISGFPGIQSGGSSTSSTNNTSPVSTSVVFSTVGTNNFVVPNDVRKVRVTVIGGGGGGNINTAIAVSNGGAAGGTAFGTFNVVPGETYQVTVGAGGASSIDTGGAPGGTGGTSSFGSLLTATGGQAHTNPGSGSGGEIIVRGGMGTTVTSSNNYPALGGATPFGMSTRTIQPQFGAGGVSNPNFPGGNGLVIVEY